MTQEEEIWWRNPAWTDEEKQEMLASKIPFETNEFRVVDHGTKHPYAEVFGGAAGGGKSEMFADSIKRDWENFHVFYNRRNPFSRWFYIGWYRKIKWLLSQ